MSYLLEAARINSGQRTRTALDQVQNNAGGFVYALNPWLQLERFLILGTSGGSYYASQKKMTTENAAIVARLLAEDPIRVVRVITEISVAGRNPKQDTVLFALAMAASHMSPESRTAAFNALPQVCRTASHLYQFVMYADSMRGWGMGFRKALLRWMLSLGGASFVYQTVKYGTRNGWSMRDILRKVKPSAAMITAGEDTPVFDFAFGALAGKKTDQIPDIAPSSPLALIRYAAEAKALEHRDDNMPRKIELATLLPHEAIPSQWKGAPAIWAAMYPTMGLTALVRNLATMTRVGLFADQEHVINVTRRLTDKEGLRKSRVHPAQMLAAWLTYKSGRSVRGDNSWTPVNDIIEALEHGFYMSFGNVNPIGNRVHVSLDISGSMAQHTMLDIPGLTPRVASAALTMIHWRTEPKLKVNVFSDHFANFDLKKFNQATRFAGFLDAVSHMPFQRTDCALPMKAAEKNRWEVDTFVIYTDNETWYGDVKPMDALRSYRNAMGIDAKLVTFGMTSTGFTIGDPNDAGTLDVVGFDLAAPNVIADFARSAG